MNTHLRENKLRGGYYTPSQVADWLTRWAVRSGSDRVLEPSCGDGVFLACAAKVLAELAAADRGGSLLGIEIVGAEASKARARISGTAFASVETADFFQWAGNAGTLRFDCVVGNPPFIRYQSFPEPSRSSAMTMMKAVGLRPNRLTNTWVPFVAVGTALLSSGGRLAMVLPAELLQVSYAAQLRAYLVEQFSRIRIMTCNRMIFPDAQQEVILVLADGKRPASSRRRNCRIDLSESGSVAELLEREAMVGGNGRAKPVRHASEKWLKYFLNRREISLMRRLRDDGLGECLASRATVDVGVVTGKNSFFVLSPSQADMLGVREYAVPLLGRSAQLKGALIDAGEFARLAALDERVLLFHVPQRLDGSLSAAARAYIGHGENQGIHRGYKCRIRSKWYCVPSVWVPDCFLFRQIYDFPRVVVNRAQATSTDTIHRMRCAGDAKLLARNLYTYLTAASSEIEGRSYGGGVLELEPREAERLLVPKELSSQALELAELDRLVRRGRLEEALDANDRPVLMEGMGLSKADCSMLKRIWRKMRDRRMSRKRTARGVGLGLGRQAFVPRQVHLLDTP